MTWNITKRFPDWGETGEMPPNGFFYEGGDQVLQKHLDALWNGLDTLEDDVVAALDDIDSDRDGVVDEANVAQDANATTYKGNDIDSDGDGQVDDANLLRGLTPAQITSSVSDDGTTILGAPSDINFGANIAATDDGDGTVTVSADDDATSYKNKDIDSDGDGTVDAADTASAYKGNDIDDDGDGIVNKSEVTQGVEVRTTDPASTDGRLWIRSDL